MKIMKYSLRMNRISRETKTVRKRSFMDSELSNPSKIKNPLSYMVIAKLCMTRNG